ncbi:MAG: cytoplasmic filament protein CfpA [bacterium]
MAIDFGPNIVHPEKPSAVGSRNSLFRDGRDERAEAKLIIDEEVDKILNTMQTKLPPEVLEKLDVMGTIKEKLFNYINQSYQNMFNRYLTTMEDEMVKKVRELVGREEMRGLARYTPREVTELLDKIGGMEKFNTGEIEKSIVNMYGHLHGHIQRGMNDLENETNAILRQKTDVGAFIRGENAYSIVKCTFKDNYLKPKTVTDVKLSINILESELISPIFHYQATVEYLIKDLIGKHIGDMINKEIDELKTQLIDEGKPELSDTEVIFEKIKRIENYTDDEKEDEDSKRYSFLAKRFLDRVEGLRAEIPAEEYDPLNIRENIKRIIDDENIRNRGYNTAINSLTSILDTSKMGYQHIENFKNARTLILREYEDTDVANLPDERYAIRLVYYDQTQLDKEKEAYDKQIREFEKEIRKIWDVTWALYDSGKRFNRVQDFDDLANKLSRFIEKRKEARGAALEEEEKLWNELTFIPPEETEVERLNKTHIHTKALNKEMLIFLRKKLQKMYGYQNPIERVVLDERLNFLESKFDEFNYMINPHHVQPGLLLDVNITSIKKKRATLMGMANVLNEFLYGVSKGFSDAAFASFSRRRSTVRADIEQTFQMTREAAAAASRFGRSEEEGEEKGPRLRGSVDISPAEGLREL